jgi:CRP-like cAMP-binding protein
MFANHTLATMAADDLAALIPHLTERTVNRGEVLNPQGEGIEIVYFPTTARLSNRVTFSDGRAAETFVMGIEGVTGLAPFMADGVSGWSVEVGITGNSWRIPAGALRQQLDVSPSLRRQFNGLVSDYQTQSAHGAACAALHHTRGRLARFLLITSQRAGSRHIAMTQSDLSFALGCQRTTIHAEADALRTLGAIRYMRGKIEILDQARLEAEACECYAMQQEMAAHRPPVSHDHAATPTIVLA